MMVIYKMFDFTLIQGFDWDAGNDRKSRDKHAVSRLESEQVFFNNPLLLIPDTPHSIDEERIHAFGVTDNGRLLHISFTLRENKTLIRIISARPMSREERQHFAESQKNTSLQNGS